MPSLRLKITVAAATIFLALAASSEIRFPDVPPGHPRAADIEYVAERGWLEGFPDGTYEPDGPVAGDQIVKAMERVMRGGDMSRAELASFLRGGFERAFILTPRSSR